MVPLVQSICLVRGVFVAVREQDGVGRMETVGSYPYDATRFANLVCLS